MLVPFIFASSLLSIGKGEVKTIPQFESAILKNKRDLFVYTPPGYDAKGSTRYPVIYMHDGQNVMRGDTAFIAGQEWRADETADMLINGNLIEPVIIVGVANTGLTRADEYLPTSGSINDPSQKYGGKANLYLKFFIEELMPYVDRSYRTKTGSKNTSLIGSSFGGIATLYMGLERPDIFGQLGVCSPSIWWDDAEMLKRISSLDKVKNVKIWMDMGSKEGDNMVAFARRANSALVDKGWNSSNLTYCEEDGGEHNESAWARRLPLILHWLVGKPR